MPKPNLFIVGAPKCGTTAWFRYLDSHPDIFFSQAKEPTYFAADLPGMQFVTSLDEYERLFRHARGAKIVGDASATHLFSRLAAAEIAAYNPDARILIFLRPQEDYLPSLHHHFLSRFEECIEDFETAWRLSSNRAPETIADSCTEPKFLDYVAMGRFHEQVSRYYDFFPASQIKVVHFHDWISDSRVTYLEILNFLGLEDDGRSVFPRVNEAKSFPVKWIGKLVTHPPPVVEAGVDLLRKIAGKDALGLGVRATNLFASRGYRTLVSPELREEIKAYYLEDNLSLAKLLESSRATARME